MPLNISIIATMTPGNHVIGKDNDLPWHLPNSNKRLRKLTSGKPVIMGRETYESFGKALPGRFNIVITSQKEYDAPGCAVVHSFGTAIDLCKAREDREVFVIGGEKIFAQAMLVADFLYITFAMAWYEGDSYFPFINSHEWEIMMIENHPADYRHECNYSFVTFKRKPHYKI
jgi:dihydrofolate reductase